MSFSVNFILLFHLFPLLTEKNSENFLRVPRYILLGLTISKSHFSSFEHRPTRIGSAPAFKEFSSKINSYIDINYFY